MKYNIHHSAFNNSFHPNFLTISNGSILDANNAAIETFGYNYEEIRNIGIEDIIHNNDPFKNNTLKCYEKKCRVNGKYTALRKNGDTFFCQYFSVKFMNQNGVTYFIDTIIDITEQKQSEEKLRVEKERYDVLTRATSDAIWDWDIINNKMYYNSGITLIFGYKQFEITNIQEWWKNKIHPYDLQKVMSKINQFLKSKESQTQFKYRFLCEDGTYKHIRDRAFLILDSKNNPIRMIGAMQDMTLLYKYIYNIRQQNKKLNKISWTQSHMVRGPLARILGFTELIKNYNIEEENIHELLNILSSSAEELDNVIRAIVKETEK